ncbi:hypothetical protein MMC28_009904 [Mycoblastus sanguinarius]|nr:hypothetical protein [Mycoblastus sanguinarius]
MSTLKSQNFREMSLQNLKGMHSLLAEILVNIFEYLSDDNLLDLPGSIVGKGLLEQEGTCRFHTITLCLEKADLERLMKISDHPIASKYVEVLIFGTDKALKLTWPEFLNYQWDMHTSYGPPHPPSDLESRTFHKTVGVKNWQECAKCDGRRLRSIYESFSQASDVQHELEYSGSDVRMLSHALERLENVKELEIDNFYFDKEIKDYELDREDQSKKEPVPLHLSNAALHQILQSAVSLEHLEFDFMNNRRSCISDQPDVPLFGILGSNKLHCLHTLKVATFQIQKREIARFLGVCTSLKSLTLEEIDVYYGTWFSIFGGLKGAYPYIEYLEFHDLYGDSAFRLRLVTSNN